jgi:hypothetical protein
VISHHLTNPKGLIAINLININKMSYTDYIIIVLGGSFFLIMGVTVAIREVIRYARPVENVLTKRRDIEMGDYIEPTQPLQVYDPRNLDLLNPE